MGHGYEPRPVRREVIWLLQLTAYGVAGWLVFVAVVFTAARLGGIVGLLGLAYAVAACVFIVPRLLG